jgi:hypothetical protein
VFRTKNSIPSLKPEHHRKKSFDEEYRSLIIQSGIKIDERYFP